MTYDKHKEIMENAFQSDRTTEWVLYAANDGSTLIFGAEHAAPDAKHKQWQEIYRGAKETCKFIEGIYKQAYRRGYNRRGDEEWGLTDIPEVPNDDEEE